ncbi:MAG: hypothetical protein C0597_10460 [Marinilabiliales bacterium]|nr:MAG: hypothetical protein C0597_10460 [Marinilabiliales bacterium]
MKITLSILTVILLFSITACKSQKDIPESHEINSEKKELEIVVKDDHHVTFQINNTSSHSVFLYQALKLHIEKLENDNWNQLKILPCPCDAPCQPPEERIEILAGESFILTWDKKESWCGTERVGNIRNTVYKTAEKGVFRIKLQIISSESKEIFYKKFELN